MKNYLLGWEIFLNSVSNSTFSVFNNTYTLNAGVVHLEYTLLTFLALSSLNVYYVVYSGWLSSTKYAFLGGIRAASQMLSYESTLGLVMLIFMHFAHGINFDDILIIQNSFINLVSIALPAVPLFFISILAETNRTPFDLPEAEAELVAGYNVEYGSIAFALFFLAEYSSMILMSTLFVLLLNPYSVVIPTFLGLLVKVLVLCFLLVLIRATVPRYRYNQLSVLGWQIFLILGIGVVTFILTV